MLISDIVKLAERAALAQVSWYDKGSDYQRGLIDALTLVYGTLGPEQQYVWANAFKAKEAALVAQLAARR